MYINVKRREYKISSFFEIFKMLHQSHFSDAIKKIERLLKLTLAIYDLFDGKFAFHHSRLFRNIIIFISISSLLLVIKIC